MSAFPDCHFCCPVPLLTGIVSRIVLCLAAMGPALLVAQPQAVILQYHHISSATPRSTSVTPDEFKAHMDYLRDHDFTVLPLMTVLTALQTGDALPAKPAVITFDDAYVSVYKTAFPLLRDYGWPFTVFVPSGLVGSNPGLYSSWSQLREMAGQGATLANHSVSHAYFLERLTGEDDTNWLARIEKEIVDAEAKILAETGQSHKVHAYPYGEYDPAIEALVERLGFIGLGQHSGPINATSDFAALPRFPFSGIYAPVRTFAPKVESLAFDLRQIEPAGPITDAVRPSAVLEFTGNYRWDALACYVNDRRMQVEPVEGAGKRFRVTPSSDLGGRRFRYNCTAPGRDGRYFWYSVPWFNPSQPDR